MEDYLMNSTLNGPEYNALLHAIWHFERLVGELGSDGDSENLEILERDLKALEGLFQRL